MSKTDSLRNIIVKSDVTTNQVFRFHYPEFGIICASRASPSISPPMRLHVGDPQTPFHTPCGCAFLRNADLLLSHFPEKQKDPEPGTTRNGTRLRIIFSRFLQQERPYDCDFEVLQKICLANSIALHALYYAFFKASYTDFCTKIGSFCFFRFSG